jgi:hypothetical protein
MSDRVQRVKRVVNHNLIAGDRPLNGLIRFDDSDSLSYMALPYYAAVESVAHTYGKTKRYDGDFRMGYWPFRELVTKLIRSLQRLGIVDESARRFNGLLRASEQPRVIEIEVSGTDHPMWHSVDISTATDSCLVYSRIIADCIGLTLPAILGDPPYRYLQRTSFRKVSTYAANHPITPLGRLFSGTSLEWFNILSQRDSVNRGLRENLIHCGADNLVAWSSIEPEGGERREELQLSQYSYKGIHVDLLASLAAICGGLFGFMDRACRFAMQQEGGIDFRECKYVWKDVIPVPGPIDFLGTMIPRLTPNQETSQAPTG